MLGSELSSAMIAAARAMSPATTCSMKSGMRMFTGQAAVQRGFLQCRQRDASSCASSRL